MIRRWFAWLGGRPRSFRWNQPQGLAENHCELLEPRNLLSGGSSFFSPGQDLGTTSGKIAVGDLNNDGFLDIATSGKVFLNDGFGSFSADGDAEASTSVVDVKLADVNRDGSLDIQNVGISGSTRINDGNGQFSTIKTGFDSDVHSASFGDINGDGTLERLTCGLNGVHLQQVRADGEGGSFTDLDDFQEKYVNYDDCALVDIDGDGRLDVIAVADGSTDGVIAGGLGVWHNDGGGRFTLMSGYSIDGTGISIGDVNRDGASDILVGGPDGLTVLLNDSHGHFRFGSSIDLGFTPSSVALGDVDGDGYLDAVVVNRDGMDFVYSNNGKGAFAQTGERISDCKADSVVLADLNNDGRLDVAIGAHIYTNGTESSHDQVLLNSSSTVVSLPANDGKYQVIRDGNDIVVQQNGGGEVYRNNIDELQTLEFVGSSYNDIIDVDFSAGNPLPVGGIRFQGNVTGSHDLLQVTGTTVNRVVHIVGGNNNGSVSIDGREIFYSGIETITDDLAVTDRAFQFGDGNDNVTLSDDQTANNGISQISSAGGATIIFTSPTGSLVLLAGTGDDTVTLLGADATMTLTVSVSGGAGNDVITGSMAADFLDGGTGNDLVNGRGGDDTIQGSVGADTLLGGAGKDSLSGGDGNDVLRGNGGPDSLSGDAGDDTVVGGAGRDTGSGGSGNDLILGGSGGDSLMGDSGEDVLVGGQGGDVLDGGDGIDTLTGGDGENTGSSRNDQLVAPASEINDAITVLARWLAKDGQPKPDTTSD